MSEPRISPNSLYLEPWTHATPPHPGPITPPQALIIPGLTSSSGISRPPRLRWRHLTQPSHPRRASPQPSCRTGHSLFIRCIWAPCKSAGTAARLQSGGGRLWRPRALQEAGRGRACRAQSETGDKAICSLDPLCLLACPKQAAKSPGE